MSKLQSIGILGGAGPLATAHLHLRLIETLQERYMLAEDEEFPEVFVSSAPSPGMSVYGFSEQSRKGIAADLSLRLAALEEQGAQVILPACNTYAAFDQELRQDSVYRYKMRERDYWPRPPAELLDLPLLALSAASESGFANVAVLCSETSRRLRLFEQRAEQFGLTVLPLSDQEQSEVTAAVGSAMSGLLRSDHGIASLIERLEDRGAEGVIIGCSELSLLPLDATDVPLIDSLVCGIDAAIEHSLKGESGARL